MKLHTTSETGTLGEGLYAFAPVHPKLHLASLGATFPHLPSPGEQVGGLGAAQEGRSIPAGSCLALLRKALRERGQGEVPAVAALVTRQDAQRGRGS